MFMWNFRAEKTPPVRRNTPQPSRQETVAVEARQYGSGRAAVDAGPCGDVELATHGALRYVADEKPTFPDRVSLRDAEIGTLFTRRDGR